MRGLAFLVLIAAAGALPAPGVARIHARPQPRTPTRELRGHAERLAARAQAGDREARRLLVEEHMPLVSSLAGRYRGLGLPLEDLAQEGAIGILKAIDNFDEGRGSSFSTYAFWRARSEITHALTARAHLIRLPRPLLERRRDLAQARHALSAGGAEPTTLQLAAATGCSPEEIDEALALPFEVDSLDTRIEDGGPRLTLVAADDVASDTTAANETRVVSAAVAGLPERKREVIRRYFGLDRPAESLHTIAADLKLSPARTRAVKDAALHELAAELESALAS